MIEVWKDIPGYEGYYQVSNIGRVKSILYRNRQKAYKKDKILSLQPNGTGYLKIALYKNGIGKEFLIHRLVASAFIPNEKKLPEVNHIDENKLNNNVDNLEWCTHIYNHHYGTRNKRQTITQQTKRGKPVIQKDLKGNVINKYKCIREANRETKVGRKEIGFVCKGIYKQAGGYRWEYDR